MKKTSKLLALLMALLMTLALGLAACGTNGDEPAEVTADEEQNSVMDFVGNYVCDRASIFISAEDNESVSAIVTWSSSAWENSSWVMSGTFDPETLQFEYHDCVKTDYVYEENGDTKSETEVYKGGHGFMTFAEGDPMTLTWQEDQEKAADGMVFEYVGVMPENGGENSDENGGEAGVANSWSTVGSAEEAASGAGIEGFMVPEGAEISLGEVAVNQFRCMEGLAEAVVEFPAVDMTIRKGARDIEIAQGDISGDYGEYTYDWKTDIDGTEVMCFGNREGEATKTIWNDGTYDYSITAFGMGGDTDYGLSADDLTVLVKGIK